MRAIFLATLFRTRFHYAYITRWMIFILRATIKASWTNFTLIARGMICKFIAAFYASWICETYIT
jgi:hypothetical protein